MAHPKHVTQKNKQKGHNLMLFHDRVHPERWVNRTMPHMFNSIIYNKCLLIKLYKLL